jgi:hypothetical protein
MHKRVVVSVLVAVLVACGETKEEGLEGTVAGRKLDVAEVRAVVAGTGTSPCTLPIPGGGGGTIDFGVHGMKVDFTSYAEACGDYASASCTLHESAEGVTVIFARLDPFGAEPALLPGVYTVQASPTTVVPDGVGLLTVAYAEALGTDATCGGTPSASVLGGTLTLESVGATVKGSVDVAFQDGSSIRGPFEASLCPGVVVDICELAESQSFCSLPATCVP